MNLSSRTVLLPSIVLLIGAVLGTTATNAFAVDDPFKNKVEIDTDVDNKDTCDESGEGFNQALCVVTDNLETETFTMQGEKNKISIDAEGENHNDCDEKGDGDNESECIITSNRGIGEINILDELP
ncbi:MAG TPA: hypothetical protein VFM20_02500 [Nitrososphaeraceae archaeon]|nr:hypothetical protein [Nitrososphaeraceae archaeon]